MKTIYIRQEPIELYKILKFENLVYGGGEAKLAISGGYVLLNGEVETQKRKKIVSGDVIEFDEQLYQIQLGQESEHESVQQSEYNSEHNFEYNSDHKPEHKSHQQFESTPADMHKPKIKAKPKRSAIKF